MKCKVKNKSSMDISALLPLLKSFLPFAQEKIGFNQPASIEFVSDLKNAELPLGKTAYYSPDELKICIFVDNRHPKDIMRSLSHELVHHRQNCNGKFDSDMEMGEGYAQNDEHLREMEKEAYLEGNMTFRDWEDKNKSVLQEAKNNFSRKNINEQVVSAADLLSSVEAGSISVAEAAKLLKAGRRGNNKENYEKVFDNFATSKDPMRREIVVRSLNYNRASMNKHAGAMTGRKSFQVNDDWIFRGQSTDGEFILRTGDDFRSLETQNRVEGVDDEISSRVNNTINNLIKNNRNQRNNILKRYNVEESGFGTFPKEMERKQVIFLKNKAEKSFEKFSEDLEGYHNQFKNGEIDKNTLKKLKNDRLVQYRETRAGEGAMARQRIQRDLGALKIDTRGVGAKLLDKVKSGTQFGIGPVPVASGAASSGDIERRLKKLYDDKNQKDSRFGRVLSFDKFVDIYNNQVDSQIMEEENRAIRLAAMLGQGARDRDLTINNEYAKVKPMAGSSRFNELLVSPDFQDILLPKDLTDASWENLNKMRNSFDRFSNDNPNANEQDLITWANSLKDGGISYDENNIRETNINYAFDKSIAAATDEANRLNQVTTSVEDWWPHDMDVEDEFRPERETPDVPLSGPGGGRPPVRFQESISKESLNKALLTEGGAAGHMAHPFDLGYVKTGQDLLNFFTDKVPAYLETNDPSIKTDGTNVSFKLVSKTNFYGEEKREFAADRGSQKAIDIEGITGDNIEQRFKPGHGLIPGILDVLAILNAALNAGVIDEEIKTMGLVDNPDYFINTEHVKETEERPQVNAIKYDENFIAFHGVNEFFMKPSPKGKSMSRKSKEVATTKNSSAALQSFTNKVRRFARDYNVYGPEDTKATKREGVSINFDSALGEKLPIFLSEGTESTDTLGGWLRNPRTINPFDATIVLADGRKMGAMSKHVYTNLAIDKVPVSDLLGGMEGDKRQMAIDAINGAIFYHATRNLGVAVLKTLDAGFGGATLDKHEGIVMRDKDVFGVTFPIKITGDFIVEGMVGAISQEMAKENPAQVKTEIKRKIAVFPGKFKPPHRGHMDLVKGLVDKDVDQVYILISPLPVKTPAGKVIDRGVSEKIWKIYIDAMGIGNKVTIGKSEYNSPVKSSFDVLAGKVSSYVPEPGDLVIPAASDKIDERSGKPDYMRFENFHKGVEGMLEGVTPANIMEWYFKAPSEAPMSATDFREALDTGIGLEAFLPAPKTTKEKVLALLGVEVEPEMDEEEPEDSGTAPALYMGEGLDSEIDRLLDETIKKVDGKHVVYPKSGGKRLGTHDSEEKAQKQLAAIEISKKMNEDELEEVSSMAAGSVEGYSGSAEKKKSIIREEEPIIEEVLNYLLSKLEIL